MLGQCNSSFGPYPGFEISLHQYEHMTCAVYLRSEFLIVNGGIFTKIFSENIGKTVLMMSKYESWQKLKHESWNDHNLQKILVYPALWKVTLYFAWLWICRSTVQRTANIYLFLKSSSLKMYETIPRSNRMHEDNWRSDKSCNISTNFTNDPK